MGKKIAVMTSACALLLITGCAHKYADVPTPTRFANENQQKLQAARHWQLIASHFAGELANSLGNRLDGKAIHIPQPGGEQPFVEGFRELLITAMFERGIPVSTTANNALVADVRYNAFRFQPERAANTRFYGEATTLAAGLWAIGGVMAAGISSATGVDAGAKLVAGVAGLEGLDWLKNEGLGGGRNASGPVPTTEILLSVSVSDNNRIISRYSSIYYSADEDIGLYWKKSNGGSVIRVQGDCGAGEEKCAR